MRNYISFDSVEIASKFDKEIILLTDNTATMGIEEFILQRTKREEFGKGMEKGRELEKDSNNFQFTKSLLIRTNHDVHEIADIVGVPISFVQMVKDTL